MTEARNPAGSPDTPDGSHRAGLIILKIESVGDRKILIGESSGWRWEASPTTSVGIVSVNAMLTPRLENAPLRLTTFDPLGGFRRWHMFGQTGYSAAVGATTMKIKGADGRRLGTLTLALPLLQSARNGILTMTLKRGK